MLVPTYLALLVLCCSYALWRGGAPERWGVAILLASIALSGVIPRSGLRFGQIEVGFMIGDLAMFIAISVLAVRAQRYWPMYMAAILLDTLITHLLMLSPHVMPWSYSAMLAGWNLVNPPLLAGGTWHHRRRLAQHGSDPAWSPVTSEDRADDPRPSKQPAYPR